MIPLVNTKDITINNGARIYLYLDDILQHVAHCTKSGTYTINEELTSNDVTFYRKKCHTIRQHEGKQYNSWGVFKGDFT